MNPTKEPNNDLTKVLKLFLLRQPIITLFNFICTFVLNSPRILFHNSRLSEKMNDKSFSMLIHTVCGATVTKNAGVNFL